MTHLTRHAALASATALCLTGAAWAQETHPETGETLAEDQTFNYRQLDQTPSLDPQLIEDVSGSHIARQIFEGLMNQDDQGELVPGVATEFTNNDDYTEFTFTLREDAVWSNGDPVTAEDFVYGWQRAVDPATASPYSWFVELAAIENATQIIAGEMEPTELGVEAVDARTLRVTLSEPTPYFADMTTHATLYPAHRPTIEEHGDAWTDPENFVGNGAFTLEENITNEYTRLVKSDSYWDADNVILEEVTFLVINDENQALTRYLAGELDHVEPVPAGRFPELQDEYPEQATVVPRLCTYYYTVNQREDGPEALKDPRVRTALALAIDRGVIVDQVLQGGQGPAYFFAHPATAGYEPPEIPYEDMTQADKDAEAQRLLEEAGVEDLTVEITYNPSESHRQVATVISQMWKQKLGVEATLANYEWQTYLQRTDQGQFEIARAGWCGDYNEASTFLDLLTSNNGNNDGRFANERYDELLQEARLAEDPLPLYHEAEKLLSDEMGIIPIYHYTLNFMLQEDIEGWPYDNVENNWYAKDLYRVADG
jgi:oligopeptide transport system substrate-binding protein